MTWAAKGKRARGVVACATKERLLFGSIRTIARPSASAKQYASSRGHMLARIVAVAMDLVSVLVLVVVFVVGFLQSSAGMEVGGAVSLTVSLLDGIVHLRVLAMLVWKVLRLAQQTAGAVSVLKVLQDWREEGHERWWVVCREWRMSSRIGSCIRQRTCRLAQERGCRIVVPAVVPMVCCMRVRMLAVHMRVCVWCVYVVCMCVCMIGDSGEQRDRQEARSRKEKCVWCAWPIEKK